MKKIWSLALVLAFLLAVPAWAETTRVQMITPDGQIHEVEVDMRVAYGDYDWPEKQSSVPYRPGTAYTINLDVEAYRLLGGSMYVGGRYAVVFRYQDDNSTRITYRFDEENSAGRITLDEQTGVFTVTEAGNFIIEVWADGQYALDGRYTNVSEQMPDMSRVRASYGGNLQNILTQSVMNDVAREAYALEAVRQTNAQRAANGLPALQVDAQLMSAAATRAGEMNTSFSHTRPNGQSASSWLLEVTGASAAGENLAAGQTTPEAAVSGWMGSAGHRENIMSSSFSRIGVGCCEMPDGRLYWVQVFAS